MWLKVIATGSKGNCYALRAGQDILLLDAGVRFQRLLELPWLFSFQAHVSGCLITHEHMDHCKAAAELDRRGVKVYASQGTIDAMREDGDLSRFNRVCAMKPVTVGQFTVLPFEVKHDAAEPLGFLVRYEPTGETLLYATDTYYLPFTFPDINYWIVECNYVEDIVTSKVGNQELSAAIRKRLQRSHMSLRRLLDALEANDLSKTRAIILVHLSNGNSDEKQMINSVKAATGGMIEVYAADAGKVYDLQLAPF